MSDPVREASADAPDDAAVLCQECAEPIGAERLAALPRAVTCIRCASRRKRPSRGRTCS